MSLRVAKREKKIEESKVEMTQRKCVAKRNKIGRKKEIRRKKKKNRNLAIDAISMTLHQESIETITFLLVYLYI